MYSILNSAFIALPLYNPFIATGGASVPTPTPIYSFQTSTLASRSFSLESRNPDKWVNSVFKDNILLTLSYLSGEVKGKTDINWQKIEEPKTVAFRLDPGKTFSFHDQVLSEFKDTTVVTTNAHFNFQDGFKSDGYLMGDGVCHIASLIYWAAKDAGLSATALSNHDFADIDGVPKEYGVAIYYLPGSFETSSRQNLYITNNRDKPVTFVFIYDGQTLTVEVKKEI